MIGCGWEEGGVEDGGDVSVCDKDLGGTLKIEHDRNSNFWGKDYMVVKQLYMCQNFSF